jgi:acylphosphatase
MSAELTTLRVRVEGRVQGVGFRVFAARQAADLNLKGWARNRADGALEALVSGAEKDVEKFVQACMRGPDGAKVTNIDLFADTDSGAGSFVVLPDA